MNDETIEDDDTRDELLNECAHKLTEIVLARLNELPILEKQRWQRLFGLTKGDEMTVLEARWMITLTAPLLFALIELINWWARSYSTSANTVPQFLEHWRWYAFVQVLVSIVWILPRGMR